MHNLKKGLQAKSISLRDFGRPRKRRTEICLEFTKVQGVSHRTLEILDVARIFCTLLRPASSHRFAPIAFRRREKKESKKAKEKERSGRHESRTNRKGGKTSERRERGTEGKQCTDEHFLPLSYTLKA